MARRRLVVVGVVVGLDWTNRVACTRKRRTQLCSVAAAVLVTLRFSPKRLFFFFFSFAVRDVFSSSAVVVCLSARCYSVFTARNEQKKKKSIQKMLDRSIVVKLRDEFRGTEA